MKLPRWDRVAVRAWTLWAEQRIGRTAAALAFYTLFSLAPILVIATAVAGAVWGREAVQGDLVTQLSRVVGAEGGRLLQEMIANAYRSTRGGWATLAAVGATLFGASAVFAELRAAFEQLWRRGGVPDLPLGRLLAALVSARLRGVAVVIGIGFVLLASLVVNSLLVSLGGAVTPMLAGGLLQAGWLLVLPWLVSFAVTVTMVALLLRVMLPVRLPRRQLGGVAVFGALAFEAAKGLVSVYLGHSAVVSTFGAAGSVAILLVWLYVVACVVLLCAVLLRAMSHDATPKFDGAGGL